MLRNAVVIASDDAILPAAIWLWRRMRMLNPRPDTDIILIAETKHRELWGEDVADGLSISAAELPLPDFHLPTGHRIPRAAYWRLAAPAHLRGRYRRIFYIDVDVLPLSQRLFDCFDYDMAGAPIAACQSPLHFRAERRPNGRVIDGKFEFDRYFNSGVLLIDIETFCREGVDRATYDAAVMARGRLSTHDQGALNIALAGNWRDLSLSFNFWPGALGTFLETKRPPWLLHYHGGSKPWHPVTPYVSPPARRELLAALWRHGRGLLRRDLAHWVWQKQKPPAFISPQNALLTAYLDQEALGVQAD